jgi:hypothetical protein
VSCQTAGSAGIRLLRCLGPRVFGVPNGRKCPFNQRMCYCREDTRQENSEPRLARNILFSS